MWRYPVVRFAAVLLAALLVQAGSRAADRESWSDDKLPNIAGLAAWYDAARINGAPQPNDPIDVTRWLDASGNGRHLAQPESKSRPTRQQLDATTVVRFDGLDDSLFADGCKLETPAATVFVVASVFDNPGEFRAFVAGNKNGANDYVSGFTLDMGPFATTKLEWLNPEGIGFGGAADVLERGFDFGTAHVWSLVVEPEGDQAVRVFIDGQGEKTRSRKPAKMILDRLTVGARCYDNFSGVPMIQGFLEGDVAEVLIFDRALADDERKQIETYLRNKHGKWLASKTARPLRAGDGVRLATVPCPDVQFFVPGFEAKALPLDLPNINNLRARPDGKIFAVAYNGDVYLLADTDGDGIEDQAALYWEAKGNIRAPIGAALLPPGDPRGQGIAVASRGKISLLVDRDGDDRGDEEIIAAEWKNELFVAVDALGVAIDPKDGAIFYGRGTTDFTTGYWLSKEGKAQYDITSDHGSILRIAPDLKSREVYATGLRFTVGLAFNRRGDLFATEQEGATWVPNGNPFDELLHIRRGRHYGFPPRHPEHLPNVIDEPSEFDYAPQHQSTCGLQFNDPVAPGGKTFGPKHWEGDALVTGYSRAKLYRTELVPTDPGYVARNHLIAQFNMLLCDMGLTLQGDLLAAVHSGGPDWGTGPGGRGKLFKLRYRDPSLPQPIAVWPTAPRELRIAFDRPVDEAALANVLDRLKIEAGSAVAAGDRFENLRPGYAVVARQMSQLRRQIPVYSAQQTPDRRTLILSTGPQSLADGYALTLFEKPIPQTPHLASEPPKEEAKVAPPATRDIDLAYDLTGALAEWKSDDGQLAWSGWLPHLDLAVAQRLTRGSAEHDILWQQVATPGTLTIRSQLRLDDMLRPAVQPGSKINYAWPEETVALEIRGRGLQSATLDDKPAEVSLGTARISTSARPLVALTVVSKTDAAFSLGIDWHTSEDARPRAFPLRRILVPWAKLESEAMPSRELPAELAGGSWGRGRRVFFDKEQGCAKCHSVNGQGTNIGPDLSNLIHRDYASVLRDVEQPSFAVNPDYVAHTYTLKDGRVLQAVARKVDGKFVLGTAKGERFTIDPAEIEEVMPSTQSIMPTDQAKTLGPDKMRDLMTFLLSPGPTMPVYAKNPPPPPPRTRAEVTAVLAGAPEPAAATKPLRILLVAGEKDHGLGEHDYPAWQKAWVELFRAAEHVEVDTAFPWPSAEQWEKTDVAVFFQRGDFTLEREADLDRYFKRGGGAVYIHWAVDGRDGTDRFAQRIGLAAHGGRIKFRHGPLDLDFAPGRDHPIARNFEKVHFHDESYWQLTGDPKRIKILATGDEENAPRPLFWTTEPTNGRVFVSILGHYSWTFDDPLFRALVLRGIAWTAKEPVDRFNDLVPLGAAMR